MQPQAQVANAALGSRLEISEMGAAHGPSTGRILLAFRHKEPVTLHPPQHPLEPWNRMRFLGLLNDSR